MFTWRPLIKIPQKFKTVHTATHNWYYIFLIWQDFSPRKKIVNWFDQRKVPKFGDAPWTWHSSNEATVPSTTPIYRRFVLSLVSLAVIKGPRWQPIELNNRHLWSHRIIGECDQSKISSPESPPISQPYNNYQGSHGPQPITAVTAEYTLWALDVTSELGCRWHNLPTMWQDFYGCEV